MAQSVPLIAPSQPTPTARTGTDSGAAAEVAPTVDRARARARRAHRDRGHVQDRLAHRGRFHRRPCRAGRRQDRSDAARMAACSFSMARRSTSSWPATPRRSKRPWRRPPAGPRCSGSSSHRLRRRRRGGTTWRMEEGSLDKESDAAGSLRGRCGSDDLRRVRATAAVASSAPSQDFTTLNDGPVNHAPIAAERFLQRRRGYGAGHQLCPACSRTMPTRMAIRSPPRW